MSARRPICPKHHTPTYVCGAECWVPEERVPGRRLWTDQTGPPGSVQVPESEWGAALFFGTLLLCCLGLLAVVLMLVGSVIFHAVK